MQNKLCYLFKKSTFAAVLVAAMTAEAASSTHSAAGTTGASRADDVALRVQGLHCGSTVRDVRRLDSPARRKSAPLMAR